MSLPVIIVSFFARPCFLWRILINLLLVELIWIALMKMRQQNPKLCFLRLTIFTTNSKILSQYSSSIHKDQNIKWLYQAQKFKNCLTFSPYVRMYLVIIVYSSTYKLFLTPFNLVYKSCFIHFDKFKFNLPSTFCSFWLYA